MFRKTFFLIALLCFAPVLKGQEAFECIGELILSLTNNNQSTFYIVEVDEVTGNIVFNPIVNSNSNAEINALGYRTTDNLMYGLRPFNPIDLYQINGLGDITYLRTLTELNNNYGYFAGSITPDGKTFVILGSGGNPFINRELIFIDLTDSSYPLTIQPLSSVTGASNLCTDIAFDPLSGKLFGFASNTRRLVEIDLDEGKILDDVYPTLTNAAAMGALFFDAFGQMWGYGNVNQGEDANTLYRLDTNTGLAEIAAMGPSANGKDGCSCPFTVRLQKLVIPEVTIPCTEVEYVFRLANLTATIQNGIDFEDVMPEELTITEIVQNPFGGNITSGVGTNILTIDDMIIPLGIDSLVVRVEVGENALGELRNQANLSGLLVTFGEQTFSDNPSTLLSFDSTTLLVNPLTVDLIHENYNLCPGDSLSLDISTLGVTYEWNDGSTNPLITIVESGTYSVTATSGCDQVIDSIIVTENSKFLNLGQDITIDLGDSIRLDVISSGFENPEYLWTDPLMNSLNCIDCEEPTARPFDDVTYTLTVTEPSGCSASDDIQVTVLKNRDIYAPNVFSPNADGLNDRFYLQAKNEILIKTLRIYNRWGAVVFEQEENVWTNGPNVGWNGIFKNKLVNNGVFVWSAEVEFLDGVEVMLSGDLTVLK